MRKRLLILLIIIVILFGALLALIAYSLRQGGITSNKKSQDNTTFQEEVKKIVGSENVTLIGESPNDMFPVKPTRISIKDEQLDIFEFETTDQANKEALRVSSDGTDIQNYGRMDWGKMPHFYKQGRIIVFYVGDNAETLDVLNNTLGKQFAGK